jgi:hypothetical protein
MVYKKRKNNFIKIYKIILVGKCRPFKFILKNNLYYIMVI